MSNIYLNKNPKESENFYFISYKREDSALITNIMEKLTKIDVWYDFGIDYGENFSNCIFSHILECKAVILFASNNIFREHGEKLAYVIMEYNYAKQHKKPILVVFLEKIEAISVPPSMWVWYQEIISLESIVPSNYKTDDELVQLIYDAVEKMGPSIDPIFEIYMNQKIDEYAHKDIAVQTAQLLSMALKFPNNVALDILNCYEDKCKNKWGNELLRFFDDLDQHYQLKGRKFDEASRREFIKSIQIGIEKDKKIV